MARLAPIPKFRVLDSNGDPLNGGKIFAYETGTSTPKATYTDAAAGSANANPVILDSDGEANIWLLTDGEYRFVIKDSDDVTLDTIDNISGIFEPLGAAYESNDIQFANNKELQDDSGNAILVLGKTTSAVNEVKLSNAATGNGPTITTQGDDTNVDLNINTQGTGAVTITAATDITGDLDVDNININGNTIVSTDTDGDIILTPNGTGDLVLDGVNWPQADGSANQLLQTDGSGQTSWITPVVSFTKSIGGFQLSQDTDSEHDINIAVGTCRDEADSTTIQLATTITKQIDASWAEGDDAGGFPAGLSLSPDTTYHVFVIKKSGGVDAGFDTNLAATNLLADATDYTEYRRVGSVVTNSSSNITDFVQHGDYFQLDVPVNDVDDTNPGTSRQTNSLTIPSGIQVMADVTVSYFDDTPAADGYLLLTTPDQTDTTPSTTLFDIFRKSTEEVEVVRVSHLSSTSGQLSYRITESQADVTVKLVTHGWYDDRGRT